MKYIFGYSNQRALQRFTRLLGARTHLSAFLLETTRPLLLPFPAHSVSRGNGQCMMSGNHHSRDQKKNLRVHQNCSIVVGSYARSVQLALIIKKHLRFPQYAFKLHHSACIRIWIHAHACILCSGFLVS